MLDTLSLSIIYIFVRTVGKGATQGHQRRGSG